jgi:hypothetical protein
MKNAACGDGKFRVRRWQSPAAAMAIPARGVWKPNSNTDYQRLKKHKQTHRNNNKHFNS